MPKILLGYNQKKLKRALFLDRALNFAFKPFISKTGDYSIPHPKKILVIQSHLIGDVVMVTPMLRALRKAYPDAQISLLANEFAKDLLEGLPYVDRIITMKFPWAAYDYSLKNLTGVLHTIRRLRKENFDLAIDAQIDMRNAFLMYLAGARRRLGYDITGGRAFLTDVPELPADVFNLLEARLALLSYLNIDTGDKKTELPVTETNIEWAESYMQQHNLNRHKTIAVHPGASAKEKLWQPEKFAIVIEYLNFRGYQPVIIEGPKDKDVVDSIAAICKTVPPRLKSNLKNVVAFVSRCRLVICLDSAALHLAAATGTPAVAIYGPKWPELTKPFSDNIEIIWDANFDCRPCEYGRCKNIHRSCMDAISPDEVISKIEKMLAYYQNISPETDATADERQFI
jgi:lipopolysaccharide heptosyltransferase II